jgi:hypothetical protein
MQHFFICISTYILYIFIHDCFTFIQYDVLHNVHLSQNPFNPFSTICPLYLADTEGATRRDRPEVLYEGSKLEIWEIEDLRLPPTQHQEQQPEERQHQDDAGPQKRKNGGRKERGRDNVFRVSSAAVFGGSWQNLCVLLLCTFMIIYK